MAHSTCRKLQVDSDFPEPRKIGIAAETLTRGGIIAYPTDTVYGMGCGIHEKRAIDRIYKIKHLNKDHLLSIVCPDLSDIARYAVVENEAYKIMRRFLPGPYTFILRATPEVPRIFQSTRKTVGIRVPNHPVTLALARAFRQPIVSTTAALDGSYFDCPDDINTHLGHGLDLILDAGLVKNPMSSVIDLSGPYPTVIREGAGDISWISV